MSNIIYQDLIKNQRKNLILEKKLSLSDLKRIASHLLESIFTENCSLWKSENNSDFVNFFFNGKKQALHRLLYYNFVDDIDNTQYLKYSCLNKGKCCCLNHIIKVNNNELINHEVNNIDINNKNKKKITVEF
jgi:hypothetical protein